MPVMLKQILKNMEFEISLFAKNRTKRDTPSYVKKQFRQKILNAGGRYLHIIKNFEA